MAKRLKRKLTPDTSTGHRVIDVPRISSLISADIAGIPLTP
jgi:hypothetical protein